MKYFFSMIAASVIGILLALGLLALVTMGGCTYNISMAHTEGTASDVIDDTQAPTNTVSPNLEIPALK